MRRWVGILVVAALALPASSFAVALAFTTPSKDIGCVGNETFVRCDISQTRTKPPRKPSSCRFDWGNAFRIAPRGPARRLCVSDSALGASKILRYGVTQPFGRWMRCTARRAGLTCRNRDGHGFFLSRERVRLF